MYRNINGSRTKLSTLNTAQMDSIIRQCKAYLTTTLDAEEMAYLLDEDNINYLSVVRCRPEVRSLAYWLDRLESGAWVGHNQISPETLEWGGGMSGQTFHTFDDSCLPTLVY